MVLTGRAPDLQAVYPPVAVDDTTLRRAVLRALDTHAGFLTDWVQSAPQTNEVRRSAALIAGAHWIAARHPLPFVTSELGASAGLNLNWDRFALSIDDQIYGPADPVLTLTPDWDGPLPPRAEVIVTDRRGVDLNPLDSTDPDQALRLFSYLWPDQPHRMELTRAAIAARIIPVDSGDAVTWLADRLQDRHPGHTHLIYHTIAWQYFPTEAQATGKALIEAAGANATEDAPLAWLRMEHDGDAAGAGLTLRLWPGDHRITLGRADFHGRWITWTAP